MPNRAVIVAAGDLANLPAEVQTVANELSEAGWQVRLCLGDDATRAGLLRAAGEGAAQLVWLALHSTAAGFGLNDGVWPAAELGVWLCNIGASDVVANACYGVQHVYDIQRAAPVNVATTIDPAGVGDALAAQVGVYLVRSYIISGDLGAAVRQASGFGSVQYRFFPAGGRGVAGGGRMPADEIREQLQLLVRAIQGEPGSGTAGLLARVNDLSVQLATLTNEQRQWRQDVERRLDLIERDRYIQVSPRLMVAGVAFGAMTAILLLVLLLRLGGTF